MRYTADFVERYATQLIGENLLVDAIDNARQAQIDGDAAASRSWCVVIAGLVVLLEDRNVPIVLPPHPVVQE